MTKAGRPSKGPRKRIAPRLPEPLADIVQSIAAESPYATENDIYVALFADLAGRPEYKPTPKVQQEELPLKTA